jgi:hypothetical protein
MSLGIDLATQNLFGAFDDQSRDLFAQLLLGADGFLFDFSLRTGNDAISFRFGGQLGFFNQLSPTAAARPSAIFFARSSSAFMMGGHTNCIVNHARMKNTTSCANRVAFRFTVWSSSKG